MTAASNVRQSARRGRDLIGGHAQRLLRDEHGQFANLCVVVRAGGLGEAGRGTSTRSFGSVAVEKAEQMKGEAAGRR
jgi:hypothetical protein